MALELQSAAFDTLPFTSSGEVRAVLSLIAKQPRKHWPLFVSMLGLDNVPARDSRRH